MRTEGISAARVKGFTSENVARFFLTSVNLNYSVVGPCHHGMARPQVADRGMASDMEGSCE